VGTNTKVIEPLITTVTLELEAYWSLSGGSAIENRPQTHGKQHPFSISNKLTNQIQQFYKFIT
jgi:hypothetical protein